MAAPALAGPRKGSPSPRYLLKIQSPELKAGVDTRHGLTIDSFLRSRLGQSPALALSSVNADRLEARALRRHLARKRLAGLSTVPRASCKVIRRGGGETVVRCKVSLLLMSMRRHSLISAYSCEAEVTSVRPRTPPAFIERMRRDVLAAAVEGAADDLVAFLEGNKPGTARLPRRGR